MPYLVLIIHLKVFDKTMSNEIQVTDKIQIITFLEHLSKIKATIYVHESDISAIGKTLNCDKSNYRFISHSTVNADM